ncbi:3-oxoacyl-ACP reductase [Tessaracoccus rhinocerotis]|uniref:3-oxoacyl-ACP reductase n=1 Tax=Tessaracoccus rhinocerotis TaxID=1689449 RepID=A0A553K235_9ACTN|nr:3-oxoacyl-ACP reductase [Tessaracoccus rhinocerotis]TRY18772.1 3-oxoacyl-ACP reductase [Tessaracoccus rhinocerotis]
MASRSILETIYNTGPGRAVARRAGLSDPPRLKRGRTLIGPVVLAELDGGGIGASVLAELGISAEEALRDLPELRTKDEKGREAPPSYPTRPGSLVVDATGLRSIEQLEQLRQVLRPAMKSLERSGRIVLLATDASAVDGLEAHAVAQGIDGINRTVGKELRGGSTSNLVFVREGTTAADLASTVDFLLEGRSAFVSGQSWRVGPRKEGDATGTDYDRSCPFKGRIVVVTGSARGIGAAISRTFARDGATVVAVDIPAAGESLAEVANEVGGSALQLDITIPEAGNRIAAHVARVHGADAKIWAIVHNAGITRDKMLANMDEKRWAQVLDVNLAAEIRMNEILLDTSLPGGLAENSRIIGIASTSGVAGNKGQTNYAASKAGVMGLVWAESEALEHRPVTVNAVAPGFIETEMTGAIPFVSREIFRRTNSLGQGGQPVDVAETIAWLANPASGGVTGQVVRVCGQNLVGA